MGTEFKARHVPFLPFPSLPGRPGRLKWSPVDREVRGANVRQRGTQAVLRSGPRSASLRLHTCLSWARGTVFMFIQRAEVGAGSCPQLGAASSAVLQVWPEGAPGGRAVQSLPGGQRCPEGRRCHQLGPPLDFSHGEILRLQGNKVICTWMDAGGRGPGPHSTFLGQVASCGPETTPVLLH